MIQYRSEDYEVINWEQELKKLLGDKFIGRTIRTPNQLIEFRTTVELEAAEVNEIKRLSGRDWIKQP